MTQLNPAQREAVEHDHGPLLVLAGAGSGKTRVITHRIRRLIERGNRPETILAVSFTNKAALEMGERMAQLVGTATSGKLWMSTFHSFGVRFLSEESKGVAHDGRFVIFDQGDSLGLVRELIKRARGGERKLDAAAVHSRISLWKNRFLAPEEVPESDFEYDAVAREIYADYESTLRSMHAVDFDDLVVMPVRTLREDPEVRAKWQARFRHLLIDEFQDTNRSQLELLLALTNPMRNVCVVGDDDQSIYGWRGAEVKNILEFEAHFPGVKTVKLEENYRSQPHILSVANAAIANSTMRRHGKTLRAVRSALAPVQLYVAADAEAEAKLVAREIREITRSNYRYQDIAILYRSNLQARLLEEELRAASIPYRMFGGTQFFDRKEVKDAAAYLRVLVNPRDELSLRRIINYPPRALGSTSIQKLAAHAQGRGRTLFQSLTDADALDGLPSNSARSARELSGVLAEARRRFDGGSRFAETAQWLFDAVGLKKDLTEDAGKSGEKRYENIAFLIRSIERYEQNERADKPSLAAFLQRLTLQRDQEEADPGNQVVLSTLHASKGLEFPVVFLVGCIEGQLPHSRTTDPKVTEAAPTDVDEERRLFYVGVTRAQDRLYLTRPRIRTLRGKTMPVTPSRFLDGLPADSLEELSDPGEQTMGAEEVAAATRELLARLMGAAT